MPLKPLEQLTGEFRAARGDSVEEGLAMLRQFGQEPSPREADVLRIVLGAMFENGWTYHQDQEPYQRLID